MSGLGDGSPGLLKVAVCQMTSVDDVEVNVEAISRLLSELESDPPDLICFPENCLYLRVREGDEIPGLDVEHGAIRTLSAWASANNCVLHLGSVPLARGGRLYNSSLLLTPDGAVHDSYQKIHLFDVDVVGHKPVRESDVFEHGSEPSIFFVKGWKFGSSICYDLRFAELYLHYAKQEVDALLIPAAFLVPTGRAHWEVLTRARAIETQAYVLAAAQAGSHQSVRGDARRATFGHSIIVDPWGTVLAECGEDAGPSPILRVELNRDRIRAVRAQIPMKNHRRLV